MISAYTVSLTSFPFPVFGLETYTQNFKLIWCLLVFLSSLLFLIMVGVFIYFQFKHILDDDRIVYKSLYSNKKESFLTKEKSEDSILQVN